MEQERIRLERVWWVVPAVKHLWAPTWVIGSLVHEALAAWRFPAGADPDFESQGEARATPHRRAG